MVAVISGRRFERSNHRVDVGVVLDAVVG